MNDNLSRVGSKIFAYKPNVTEVEKRRLYVFVGSICAVFFLPSTLAFVAIADGCRRHVIYAAIPDFHIVSVKYLVQDV